jgi:hypothetical protein
MPNPRELSQFASFIEVDDTTKNIGIATAATPYVGIGTLTPQEKLHVVGNLKVDGIVDIDNLTVGVGTFVTLNNPNLSVTHLVVSAGATIPTLNSTTINAGIVTGATYYGNAQYMSNVGLAVTYIDNNVTIAGTITVNELVLTGGGGVGGGAGIAASTINITGISTLGGIKISAGIITAGSGTTTVVYYGDGYNLSNIQVAALTGFQVAIHRRSASGRFTLGQNITKISVAANDTFQVTARSGIVTVSIGDSALPPLTV